MRATSRISDYELRERLESHGYNVPPITDTTRTVLFKKLNQLDEASRDSRRRYSGLDYSSAEEEDLPAPLASSTRTGRSLSRHQHEELAVTSRVRHTNGGQGGRVTRKQASLMSHSEEEDVEDEEEEEEEDVEEEEEEDESEEEEDVDRVDFAMQTSLLDSPSPQLPHTATPHSSTTTSQPAARAPNACTAMGHFGI